MATGVPKIQWQGSETGSPRRHEELRIDYPGRLPEEHYLTLRPPEYKRVAAPSDTAARIDANRLFFGDNLGALALLQNDRSVAGKVTLIYIDPPYSTNSVFQSRDLTNAYADVVSGSEYLEFLRARLILMRELLSSDGSIYVHLDGKMAFHGKLLLDEVFGSRNFRNCITRKKCSSKNYTQKSYGNVADYIFFYTKSERYCWNRPHTDWDPEHALREYPYVEPETGRRYKRVPVHAPGVRKGATGGEWRGKKPPTGRHWKCSPDELEHLDREGRIYWSATGNPRKKVYLDESAGLPVTDLWLDCRDAHNQNIHITGYPTEKNERMLHRIIAASSEPGSLVLDCFLGSGTTVVAAEALGRRWIGMDDSSEAIRATLHRLRNGTVTMREHLSQLKRKRSQGTLRLGLGERHRADVVLLAEQDRYGEATKLFA